MGGYVDVGVGNLYRKMSQYPMMRRWEKLYEIKSGLQAPYDPYINDDPNIFSFECDFSDSLDGFSEGSYDLVFNFGFVQRDPRLIHEMRRLSRRYVAAFVPNVYNFGHGFIHPFYHKMTRSVCNHIDRGDKTLMTLHGLESLFEKARLTIVEKGFVDVPPWLDTVVHLSELFGSSGPKPLRLPLPKALVHVEKLWPHWFKKVQAHHVYALAKCNEH